MNLQNRQSVRAELVRFPQLLVSFLEALGADVGANPQSDAKRLTAPGLFVGEAGQFSGAHQGSCTLELLSGQQPQRVAHQHRYPVAAIEWAVGGLHHTLSAPDGECVGG